MKQSRKDKIKGNIQGGKQRSQGKHPGNTPFTAPLTKPQANEIATKRAQAEAAPLINAIKGEREGSKAREKDIGQWFGQLGEQANQAAQATDASYAQANSALQAHMDAATKAAQESMGQVAASNASTAALTGADPSLFAPVQNEAAAAANQRNLTSAALAAPIAQAGAAQAGYLRGVGLNAGREGIYQRGLESKRRTKIKEDLTAARKARVGKKYEFLYDPTTGLRQSEINNEVKQKAFGLEKKTAGQDAAQAAASQRLDEEQFTETQRHDRADEANAAAGNASGGLTPTQRHAAKREKHNAWVAAQNLYQAAKKPPQSDAEWAAFAQLVASEDGIDPTAAKKAVSRLRSSLGAEKAPSSAVKDATPHFP